LAGLTASLLLRGVDFIQIPTTLLAQVDSSVGGKTGINTRYGKNMVGSFHQPAQVIIDVSLLSTLPERELRAGYAEVVKYGLIGDADFFAWLELEAETLLSGDAQLRIHAIARSCAAKAAIVARDEREAGERALLNLGHTFGHALEAETGFCDTLLHGEAVAIGMHMAFRLSARMGLCSDADAKRVESHLQRAGLPAAPREILPAWNTEALLAHMARDKKATGGMLTFILVRGIGQAFTARNVPADTVKALLEAMCR
jgi:3-dehydroquinate synthase